MSYTYLIPRVNALLPGYNCTVFTNPEALARRLRDRTGVLSQTIRIYHEGAVVEKRERQLEFNAGELLGPPLSPYTWHGDRVDWDDRPGFLEEEYVVADQTPRLISKYHEPGYILNWAPDRKSFLTNATLKFADPRVISQIATYKRFVDTFSAVWLDRERDYGESFVFSNPFTKTIIAQVLAEDARSIRRIKIPALSGRRISLEPLLGPDETTWRNQVQVTANNRLLVSDCKHSLRDPTCVTDFEHLDPHRTEPTHFPAFRWLRLQIGRFLANHGVNMKRLRT